jgi:RNA methyltransferase, TrmH family
MQPFKADLKWVKSLHQKKTRQETALFFAEGKKMVEEALASGLDVRALFTTDAVFSERFPSAFLLKDREMAQISALSEPPGYLVVLAQPKVTQALSEQKKIIVLDGIADPGNLGTILRTADWFGIRHVVLSDDCVELYNPKVVQSSMGSIFRMEASRCILSEKIPVLKKAGFAVAGADLKGDSIYSATWPEKMALLMGSESHGIRPEVSALLSHRIHIPGAGMAESLNASVAAGIIMAEWFKSS